MITMSELVKDPIYRAYLETKPELPAIARSKKRASSPPWVVYVQREMDGKWGHKDFWKYSEAFHFMRRHMQKGAYDAALNCKRYGFDAPGKRVRIKGKFITGSDGVKRQATKVVTWRFHTSPMFLDQPQHHWCKYCRRPTVFKAYTRHKRLGNVTADPRCCICGASSRIALMSTDRWFRVH